MGQAPGTRLPPLPFPPSLLGLRVSGDIAGYTIYQTRRGQTIFYPASPPKEPATQNQLAQRARWRAAAQSWKAASQATRADYERISIAASLCATGYDLWVHMACLQRAAELASLIRITGITIPMPPPV